MTKECCEVHCNICWSSM